jgi:hypothetical protein
LAPPPCGETRSDPSFVAPDETAAESPRRPAREPRATHFGYNPGGDESGAATQSGGALGCSETLALRQPRDRLRLRSRPRFRRILRSPKMKTPCADVGERGESGKLARAFSESLGYGAELWPRRFARAWSAAKIASTAKRPKTKRARSCSTNASVTQLYNLASRIWCLRTATSSSRSSAVSPFWLGRCGRRRCKRRRSIGRSPGRDRWRRPARGVAGLTQLGHHVFERFNSVSITASFRAVSAGLRAKPSSGAVCRLA